jgi:hypothetical protein
VKRTLPLLLGLLVVACGGAAKPEAPPPVTATATAARTPEPVALCRRGLSVHELGRAEAPGLTEASGLARTRTGTFWTHNDSGDGPRVFELGPDGTFLREVTLTNAQAVDWEDIAIRGRTLYAADIGDNTGQRPEIAVYRFAIPQASTTTATKITLRYPDRPHDAEALLVDPRSGELAIVTKNFGGAASVYAGRGGTLELAATVDLGLGQAVTAGDVSADGRTIVLRSYDTAFVWRKTRDESIATALKRDPECAVDAQLLDEGQGESLALSRDGDAFYTLPEGANPTLRRYGG